MTSSPRKTRIVLFTTEMQTGGVQLKVLNIAKNLNPDQFEIHVLSNGKGDLMSQLKNLPQVVCHDVFLLRRSPNLLDVISFFSTIFLLREIRPDVIDYTGPKAAIVGAVAAWLCRIPKRIYTIGGMTFNESQILWKRTIFLMLEKILCWLSTDIINVCRTNYQKMIRYDVTVPSKLHVVYSGYDLNRFLNVSSEERSSLRAQLGWSDSDFVVLQVSKLIPSKNNVAFFQIAKKVLNNIPNCKFCLVGDGPERDVLASFIKNEELSENCFLLGLRRDVPQLMAAADVVTLTSKYPEGLPQVCSQAMAAGKPMVMYDWEGICEELHHGRNGFLIEPDDLTDFSRRIEQLAADGELIAVFGRQSRELLNCEHELSCMLERLQGVYLSL